MVEAQPGPGSGPVSTVATRIWSAASLRQLERELSPPLGLPELCSAARGRGGGVSGKWCAARVAGGGDAGAEGLSDVVCISDEQGLQLLD
jgi:hypothetical protein